jgi:hypothetical protein
MTVGVGRTRKTLEKVSPPTISLKEIISSTGWKGKEEPNHNRRKRGGNINEEEMSLEVTENEIEKEIFMTQF